MIRADRLKSMVDSCAKIFGKTDESVIGVKCEGGQIEVFAAAQTSAIKLKDNFDAERPDDFEVGIEAEAIQRILQGCGNSEISIGKEDRHFVVRGVVNAKLPTMSQNPKIKITTVHKYIVPAEWFRQCCVLTSKFAAAERGTHALNCGHFEIEDGLATFAATDGRKGVYSAQPCEQFGDDLKQVNVPVDSTRVMASALPPGNNLNASIEVGDSGFKVVIDNVTYWCLQVEGTFPSQWRDVFPKAENLAPIDGKHLSRFSNVMDQLDVERAKFVSDGTSLKIFGKSQRVPEIDTKLDITIEECEMYLSPSLLAGATLNAKTFEFGWGKRGDGGDFSAAVFVAEPFTAIALNLTP